jgi:cell division protein ZapD
VDQHIIYEQPLNERIRTFLRLEFLFMQALNSLERPNMWDSRATITAILDILSIFTRADLKNEILKEMDRHIANLARLEQNPKVDRAKLNDILDDLDVLVDRLHAMNGQAGLSLRNNEFLNSIRQRSTIPGGSCAFDLPHYHFWLQHSPEVRQQQLLQWFGEFDAIRHSVILILRLIRESAPFEAQQAESGFFQSPLDASTPYQLIRIALPYGSPYFAEISGGRHRFSVRFMEAPSTGERPQQSEQEVAFGLACCAI